MLGEVENYPPEQSRSRWWSWSSHPLGRGGGTHQMSENVTRKKSIGPSKIEIFVFDDMSARCF